MGKKIYLKDDQCLAPVGGPGFRRRPQRDGNDGVFKLNGEVNDDPVQHRVLVEPRQKSEATVRLDLVQTRRASLQVEIDQLIFCRGNTLCTNTFDKHLQRRSEFL